MSKRQSRTTEHDDKTSTLVKHPDTQESLRILLQWNESLTNFYFGRMQQYWKMPLELPKLGTMGEIEELQSDFARRMVDDYSKQAERLIGIVKGELQDAPNKSGTDYAALILKAQQDAAQIIDQAKAQAQRIIASAEARLDEGPAKPETQTAPASAQRKSA